MKDFSKFKPYLIQYLRAKEIDTSVNPILCFNPDHLHANNTPSMDVRQESFTCYGTCGAHGDIYDACQMLTGLTDKIEQYKEVERVINGYNEEDLKTKPKRKFQADPAARKQFESFLRGHKGRDKGVKNFLKQRGYDDILIGKIQINYAYWPGYEEASKILDTYTLFRAGIPNNSWKKDGVVVKLGDGYKLLWYSDKKDQQTGKMKRVCEKSNSLAARVFPAPYRNTEITGTVLITEAETSAISMRATGFSNTFAAGSTNGITKNNAHLLHKAEKIVLVFDGDNPGYYYSGLDPYIIGKDGKKTTPKTAAQKIFDSGYTGKIYATRLTKSKDGDDFIREGLTDNLRQLIDDSIEIFPDGNIKVPLKNSRKPEKSAQNGNPEEGKDLDKKEPDPPFRFLGFDERYYYILPKNQNIPVYIGRGENGIKNWLFEIARKAWWTNNFYTEKGTEEGEKTKQFNRTAAIQWFREEAFKVGIYDDKKLKGVGVYFDSGKYLINTGTELKTSGGKTIQYNDWKGENIYVQSKRKFEIKGKKWTTEEGQNLFDQINTFTFEKKIDPVAVLGFLSIACFSGVLPRRPCIWLTGPSGSGKSTLLDEIVIPAIGGEKLALLTEGISSEAYIRQSIKRDFIPVVVDEMEAETPKERLTVKNIVRLNRSSYGGKSTGKGSTGSDPIEFNLGSMFCFASVAIILSNQADASRIHITRLRRGKGKCKAPENFNGLRARTLLKLPKIMKDLDVCKKNLLDANLSPRMADTYAPLLVSSWNVLSDDNFMAGKNDKLISLFYNSIMELQSTEFQNDEDLLMLRILETVRRIDSSTELTISEMLTKKKGDEADGTEINYSHIKNDNSIIYDKELQRIGIRRMWLKDDFGEVIAIQVDNTILKEILKDSAYEEYSEILKRNVCAHKETKKEKFAGINKTAIILDWDKVKERYFGEVKNDFF